MPISSLEAALEAFRAVVGPAHVVTGAEALERAEMATFSGGGRVLGVVRPKDRAEVAELLRAASRERVCLHPVSGGKNWGLGSKRPVEDAVLLDLGRLNRVLELDEELGFAVLEPGVTFRQLHELLRARKSQRFVATTGGSPDGSVLANAIERGDGSGPHGDRATHLAALEVVLATGEVVHTGFARFGDVAVAPLHRYGVGPALDGLFTQSNLGVVTRGAVWLARLPRFLGTARFGVREPARLAGVVDAVRELLHDGTLRTAVGLWNDLRVASAEQQYPWQRAGGVAPLPAELARQLRDAHAGFAWHGLAAVYAPSADIARAQLDHVASVLGGHVDSLDAEIIAGDAELETDDPALRFLCGVPHVQSLASAYWRKRIPVPAHPDLDADRCGVLWLCPTLPLRGRDALSAVGIAERILAEHGFEPLFALVAQPERTAFFLPMLVYDRDEAGADARALACHDALLAELVSAGYLPHRLGVQSMASLPAPRDDWAAVRERLRRALDPESVLSPGRYDFRPKRQG